MTTGIVKDWRYLEHRMGDYHPESPQRLDAVYRMVEQDPVLSSFPIIEPRPATEEEITLVHTKTYFNEIKETAVRERVYLDPDTSTSPRSFEVACLAAGGLLRAADMIMEGSINNGFALVRPPGHHAEASQARGFCIFNNVAIASQHLIKHHGLRRILIVDWDLHHGNGTQHSFYSRNDVLYFSLHQFPHYPGTGFWNEIGSGKGEGFTINVPLTPGKTDADYLFIFERLLSPVAAAYEPEFVLVSAGFDIYAGDPLGGMSVSAAGFSGLTAAIMNMAAASSQGRLLLTLEGGYNLEGLEAGVRNVLLTLGGQEPMLPPEAGVSASMRQEVEPVFKIMKMFWPVEPLP
ncbi:MAG: histone deacetylase [Clostridiales bacterium]|nr:histone deacetylase [Clostridiales bacterium]